MWLPEFGARQPIQEAAPLFKTVLNFQDCAGIQVSAEGTRLHLNVNRLVVSSWMLRRAVK
jgi:hypothetical protein